MTTPEFNCFVVEIDDVPLYFHIIKLEKQCYVWVGAGAAKLTSLYAAMPTKLDSVSSVTSLLPMSADDTALTMAQRIVRKVGIPIVLSVNLPTNSSSLQLAAERQIVEELQKLYPCRETRLN